MGDRKGIMLCYPFEEKRLAKWQPPYIVQPKFDGERCKSYCIDGEYYMLSSEENPFFSVPHIRQTITKANLWQTLDGELYSHKLHQEGGFELIHSIVSRTVNPHPRFKEMKYYLYDLENGYSQIERLSMLERIKELNLPNIVVAPYWVCESLDDVKKVYDEVIKSKYEGIIVRHLHAPYVKRRSTFIMKFKPKKKDRYTLIGWNEEIDKDGFPKGRVGSLILTSEVGYEFSVGAGLDAEQKGKLWDMRDKIGGQLATVYYQNLTNKKVPRGAFDIKIPELGIE